MTVTVDRATGERWCSQHRQPRSQCRPADRHAQPLRCSDELMAQVEAIATAAGMTRNDALEMALEALVRTPMDKIARQALADGRIRRIRATIDG